MQKQIELEMRILALEKMVQEIVKSNPLVNYPDHDDIMRIKMEALQTMRAKYPNEKIDWIG